MKFFQKTVLFASVTVTTYISGATAANAIVLSGTYKTPDLKIVQYIDSENFSIVDCTQELSFTVVDPLDAFAACSGLSLTANPVPPTSFSNSSWELFKASKEYRGYTHIPSIELTYQDGKLVNYSTPNNEFSYGYTSTRLPFSDFGEAEPYTAISFNDFTLEVNTQGDAVIVSDSRASRLSESLRRQQAFLTTYDAPFIYTILNAVFKVDGTPSTIDITRSIFPSTRLYLNDELTEEREQMNLAEFIISGGKLRDFGLGFFDVSPPGEGNFAPPGQGINLLIPPPIDLAFVFDTTGSMNPYIDAAKASSIGILSALDSSGSDYRVAVTDYKDFPVDPYGGFGDYPYRAILPFSTDEEVIRTAINGITVGGGGDLPESAYSGLIGTLLTDGINDWRQNAEKVLVVLTDAPPHSPEPFTGYIASDVIDLANSIDPAIIYSIVVGSDPSSYNFFAELSQRTGGRVYRSESSVGLEDLFLNVIDDIVNDVTDKSKPQSVPEPASIFSLLTFSAFSASSCKRRKKQQN